MRASVFFGASGPRRTRTVAHRNDRPARDLEAQAEVRLRRPLPALRNAISDLGRQVGPPWGADQKMAALLAWLLLEQGN
jgi:hypothetical protein